MMCEVCKPSRHRPHRVAVGIAPLGLRMSLCNSAAACRAGSNTGTSARMARGTSNHLVESNCSSRSTLRLCSWICSSSLGVFAIVNAPPIGATLPVGDDMAGSSSSATRVRSCAAPRRRSHDGGGTDNIAALWPLLLLGLLSEPQHVTRPEFRCLPLLRGEVMSLIDADDASEGSARMIQQPLNRRQIDAEPRHAARRGAPEVVQPPGRHVRGQ